MTYSVVWKTWMSSRLRGCEKCSNAGTLRLAYLFNGTVDRRVVDADLIACCSCFSSFRVLLAIAEPESADDAVVLVDAWRTS